MLIKRCFSAVAPRIGAKELKTNPELDYVITRDLYRVDVGLVISRRPIYWNLSDVELDSLKQTHKLYLKHELYPPIFAEFLQYDRKELLAPSEGRDEYITHRKKTGKARIDYRANSKRYEYADPKTLDNTSIQHAGLYETYLLVKRDGRWQFPSVPMNNNNNFETRKEQYFNSIADDWSVAHAQNYPLAVKREEIPEREKSDSLINSKCVGRKIFLFTAFHNSGTVKFKRDYEEHVWASKLELSKYLSLDDFAFYSKLLRPN